MRNKIPVQSWAPHSLKLNSFHDENQQVYAHEYVYIGAFFVFTQISTFTQESTSSERITTSKSDQYHLKHLISQAKDKLF